MIHLYKESQELKSFMGKNMRKKNVFKKANAELKILSKESVFSSYKLANFKDL